MAVETIHGVGSILIGVGATLVTDLWALFLKRTFKLPSLSYCLVGRWLLHMPAGIFAHGSIAAAPRKRHECAVGWIAHYAIGAMFAFVFIGLVSVSWLAQPTILPALLFGLGTVVFPFFLMQPSLGFGVAGAKTPKPAQARLKSLVTHAVFGLGLYASAVGLSHVLRIHA